MLQKTLLALPFMPFSALAAADTVSDLKHQLDLLNQKVEVIAEQMNSAPSQNNHTQLGGYGELHYNVTDGKDSSFDFHRFVFLLDHRFSSTVKFYCELEVEHAYTEDGEGGAVELEQAYIDWQFKPNWFARFGMMLQPVGFINETHEPDTFYGVERPVLEKDILPTTWWSSGIGLGWRPAGWKLDAMITEGLYDTNGTAIRKARQKSSKTTSSSLGYTLRADYTAIPGLTVGTSLYYQSDLTQGDAVRAVPVLLNDVHLALNKGAFGFRAVWANWQIDGDTARVNNQDNQSGYYLEPSYKITDKLGVFTRYTAWHTDQDDKKTRWLTGVNYWIHPNVVLKADIRSEENNNGYNLGVGYSF